MTDQNDERQLLGRIERRLKRIERDLMASTEDQIFFGLVLSLAVFLVALPLDDLATAFQDFLKLTQENSAVVAQSIKYASATCLTVSTVARYYGILVGRVRSSKAARALSIECLVMAWDAFLFVLVVSLIFGFSGVLGIFTIPIVVIVVAIVFVGMAKAERKILSFYASRYLIYKKDVNPAVSNFFLLLALSLDIIFSVLVTLAYLGKVPASEFAAYFLAGWALLFVLFMVLFSRSRRPRRATTAWRSRA